MRVATFKYLLCAYIINGLDGFDSALHDTVVMLYKLHRATGQQLEQPEEFEELEQQQQQCCFKILFNFVLNNNNKRENDDDEEKDDDDEDVSVGGWLPTAATDG